MSGQFISKIKMPLGQKILKRDHVNHGTDGLKIIHISRL
jgi:hypothetical protein